MKHTKKNMLAKAMACGFIAAAALGWLRTAGAAEQLPESVLRLHVVANSDSPEDQRVKLMVRDAVLREAENWCGGAESLEEANFAVCTHLEGIVNAANRRLAQAGYGARARGMVTEMYFPTKEYKGFALPAGRYRALRVTIGEGKGRNWWCVVFPALCLGAARGDVLGELPEGEREVAEGGVTVGFKVAEWYEEVKNWLRGK